MNKRINELLNETFVYAPEKLRVSEEHIAETVPEGKYFRGKFSVDSPSGSLVRGFLYTTNDRATFSPRTFVGRKETFFYEINTTGLVDGEKVEGAFVICSASGEYTLPYCLLIQGKERGSSQEEIEKITPEQFTALAKEDFNKAYMLFASRRFPTVLKEWDAASQSLYEGLAGQSVNYHSLEQFLVGLGQKEPMTLSLENDHVYLNDPQENEREEVLLSKNTWGFSAIHISCDAPFLSVERPDVTTEEFVGSTYSVGFVVHTGKLHAGRNFAKIQVSTECRELECIVEIRKPSASAAEKTVRFQRQEIMRLLHTYVSYRAGRLGIKEWSGISLKCLDNIGRMEGTDIFFGLYRAYILFEQGDFLEAQMALGELTARKEELVIPQWKGCYLYLTTFENKEKDYVNYVKEEIRDLFLANQENWILQWLMLRVNSDGYRNDTERFDAIRRQYICGCHSPVLYMEAWEILNREPLMLRNLEEFEIHLLGFFCKEKLLNREISGQAAQLANRYPSYHALLYRVLCRCYDQFPGKNMLTAICALLMKGHKNSPQYARWFELGVRQDLRLAGLYEYFAQTADDLNVRELPQAVRMYFSYQNTLGYVKKAAIYANIIRGRSGDAQTFETYRPAMERFMEEQLAEGRINEDLALIYEALLTRSVIDDRLTEGLSKVLFTCEIICKNPQIHHAVVVHRQLRQEQRVQFIDGKAYVQRYSPDCGVLLEDKNGVRYADHGLYTVRKLLTRTAFEEYCRKQKKLPEGLLLHDCHEVAEADFSGENIGRFVQFMGLPRLRESFRRTAEERLLHYFAGNPQSEYALEYLRLADCEDLAENHMREITLLLVDAGMEERAWELLQKNGAEHTDVGVLLRLCRFYVEKEEQEENPRLLSLCLQCFLRGTYDEAVLKYLLRWYEGPVETMKSLWEAGQRFSLEDFSLEEKILATVLYVRRGMENTEEIFESYRRKQGNIRLCRAYVIWMSYCYFVREMAVRQPVFTYIEQYMNGEADAPQICQLALLCYYAQVSRLNVGQQKWLYRLMEKFTEKGYYFRFYQKLPGKLLRHFHLHDKYILEYRTDPKNHVTLHYRLNGQKEQTVPMLNIYEGIFVADFTLFYQDRLEWYLSVENGHEVTRVSRQTISCSKRSQRGSTGRYELINRLAEAQHKHNEAQAREIREQYIGQQYLVDELFRIS